MRFFIISTLIGALANSIFALYTGDYHAAAGWGFGTFFAAYQAKADWNK